MKTLIQNQKLRAQTRGQTMMEYILLVALLAIGSIPVVAVLGDMFRDRVMNSAEMMMGGPESSYQDQASDIMTKGKNRVRRTMKNFNDMDKSKN